MAIIFFEIALINPVIKFARRLIIFITIGLIFYELIQFILPGTNTCDWRDIIATIIAGFLSWGIFEFINLNFIKEK